VLNRVVGLVVGSNTGAVTFWGAGEAFVRCVEIAVTRSIRMALASSNRAARRIKSEGYTVIIVTFVVLDCAEACIGRL
jgi:hypothetical protein